MNRSFRCILILIMSAICSVCAAHEVRPAFLLIVQSTPTQYQTTFRAPARGALRLGIYLEMPADCRTVDTPLSWTDGSAFVDEAAYECPGGLAGMRVEISGLESTMTDALARFERLDGTTQIARLTPAENAFFVAAAESRWQVMRTYFALGVEHILLGIDHLMFVLALLILVPNIRTLVWTITAFTAAHSITLVGATLGLVKVPQQPVEAVIALSILFVAVEIIHHRRGKTGVTRRWPWIVAFAFGLLHGFGFAGALSEIGLPEHAIPLALLFFNIGVEAGQLLFITTALFVWGLLKRVSWSRWTKALPVYGIGAMAAFWTIERISGFPFR